MVSNMNLELWGYVVMTPPTPKDPPKWICFFPTKEGLDKFMTPFYIESGYTSFPLYKEVQDK